MVLNSPCRMKFFLSLIICLNYLEFGATLPQYYNNNPWSIAVDAIYQNALVGIQASLAQRSLLQECTNNGLCGYGAECIYRNKNVVCQCKAGFSGQSRVGEEAQCRAGFSGQSRVGE